MIFYTTLENEFYWPDVMSYADPLIFMWGCLNELSGLVDRPRWTNWLATSFCGPHTYGLFLWGFVKDAVDETTLKTNLPDLKIIIKEAGCSVTLVMLEWVWIERDCKWELHSNTLTVSKNLSVQVKGTVLSFVMKESKKQVIVSKLFKWLRITLYLCSCGLTSTAASYVPSQICVYILSLFIREVNARF